MPGALVGRMGEAIQRLGFIMEAVLRVAYYRSLHLVSVPFNPFDVALFAKENEVEGGAFGGRLEEVMRGPILMVWIWKGIKMGEGLTMDAWIYGFRRGAQTVITRTGFWKLNFGRRSLLVAADPLGLITNHR